jgi:hypothetical protein
MKTCPSGLPSMYVDIVGRGTASLQNPVGDFCDPKAQQDSCGVNYGCFDMENSPFLSSLAYEDTPKYVKCASDFQCTPFSQTRKIWVGGFYAKLDAKCDSKEGFCIWDSAPIGVTLNGSEKGVFQSVVEEKFNGKKPLRDDSIYGLIQTVVGKPTSQPTNAGLCLGVNLDFESWQKVAVTADDQTKMVTFGGMSDWVPKQATPPTNPPPTNPPTGAPTKAKVYTGSPTIPGGTGAPTAPTAIKEDDTNNGSALHPGFVGLAAAAIVLAF